MRTEATVYFQDRFGFRSFGPFRGPRAEAKADTEAARLREANPSAAVEVAVVRIDRDGGKTVTRDPFAGVA